MLTLAKVGDTLESYYKQDQDVSKSYYSSGENYYDAPDHELHGDGVDSLGFDREGNAFTQFRAHVANRDGYIDRNGKKHRAFKAQDITFSASKSVSMAYAAALARGDHAEAERITNDLSSSVKETLDEMQKSGTFKVNIKMKDGSLQTLNAKDTVFCINPPHLTNRAQDPQLHIHVLAANNARAVGDPSGELRAVNFGQVYTSQKFWDGEFQNRLASKLQARHEIDFAGNGRAFEIAGTTEEQRRGFSRKGAIEEVLQQEFGVTYAEATSAQKNAAGRMSRQEKTHLSPVELEARWTPQLAALGVDVNSLAPALSPELARDPGQAPDLARTGQGGQNPGASGLAVGTVTQNDQVRPAQEQRAAWQRLQDARAARARYDRQRLMARYVASEARAAQLAPRQTRTGDPNPFSYYQHGRPATGAGETPELGFSYGKTIIPHGIRMDAAAASIPLESADRALTTYEKHAAWIDGMSMPLPPGESVGRSGQPQDQAEQALTPTAKMMRDRVAQLEKIIAKAEVAQAGKIAGLPPERQAKILEATGLRLAEWRAERDYLNTHLAGMTSEDLRRDAVKSAVLELEQKDGVFTRQGLINQARKEAHANGVTIDSDQFDGHLKDVSSELKLSPYELNPNEPLRQKFTTEAARGYEITVRDSLKDNTISSGLPLDKDTALAFWDDFNVRTKADKGYTLNESQRGAYRHLIENHDSRIICIQGRAGTGKSTSVLRAYNDHITAQHGDKIQGLSTAAAAAANLQAEAGTTSTTIAGFLKRVEKGDAATLARISGGVLLVDEAGMVSSKDMAALIDVAKAHDSRLVLVGDTDQLPPVGAGAPFRVLQERGAPTYEMREIMRQKDAKDSGAVLHLVDRKAKKAFKHFEDSGAIQEIKDRKALVKELVREKVEGMKADAAESVPYGKRRKDPLIIVQENKDREVINAQVRKELRAAGLVSAENHEFMVTDKDGVASKISLSVGDEIVFLQNDKELGVSNSDRGKITSIEGDKVTVQPERGGDPVKFHASQYQRYSHAYALTSYKSQGASVGQVRYFADHKSGLMHLQEFVVGVSRHKDAAGLKIYTTSTTGLKRAVDREKVKVSVLEEDERARARAGGHPYAEAMAHAVERRNTRTAEIQAREGKLIAKFAKGGQGRWSDVPAHLRKALESDYAATRQAFRDEIRAAQAAHGAAPDGVTKRLNQAVTDYEGQRHRIRREKEAVEARRGLLDQKTVTHYARMHEKNEGRLDRGIMEFQPEARREAVRRQAEDLASRQRKEQIPARDKPAHVDAECHARAAYQEIQRVQKEWDKRAQDVAKQQRAEREKLGDTWTPEDNRKWIEEYKRLNEIARQKLEAVARENVQNPEAAKALAGSVQKWQQQQDQIKRSANANIRQYKEDMKRAQTEQQRQQAKESFQTRNEQVKALYRANKSDLQKAYTQAQQYIKETRLEQYYNEQQREAPARTVGTTTERGKDGSERTVFAEREQAQEQGKSGQIGKGREKWDRPEIKSFADSYAEYQRLTEAAKPQPQHEFSRDLERIKIEAEKQRQALAREQVEARKEAQEKGRKDIPREMKAEFRQKQERITSNFKEGVQELAAKHGGTLEHAERIQAADTAHTREREKIVRESRALYEGRQPTEEQKREIIERHRKNDERRDQKIEAVKRDLDQAKERQAHELKKAAKQGRDLDQAKAREEQEKKKPLQLEPEKVKEAFKKASELDREYIGRDIEAKAQPAKLELADRQQGVGVACGAIKAGDETLTIIDMGNGRYLAAKTAQDPRTIMGQRVEYQARGRDQAASITPRGRQSGRSVSTFLSHRRGLENQVFKGLGIDRQAPGKLREQAQQIDYERDRELGGPGM